MIARLLYLNWKLFLARLTRLQAALFIGYSLFLVGMFINILGTAVVVIFLDSTTAQLQMDLPWLTADIHHLILLVFANVFWILHFSFTSTRLLNVEENRKLLTFGYPANKLAWHLNLMSLYHPVNIIYNLTWIVFLGIQINSAWNIPVLVCAVLLNYGIIYSIKQRFLKVMEHRFKLIVGSGLFVLFGVITLVAIITRDPATLFGTLAFQLSEITAVLYLLPGGLLFDSATYQHELLLTVVLLFFMVLLIWLIFRDHYYKTLTGLYSPEFRKTEKQISVLWSVLKKWMGPNAGKYFYYVAIHPYNRLQLLAIFIIPLVYVPLLLMLDFGIVTQILVPTLLAAIPVALLAMGMANMFGYEHREMLLHTQLPVSLKNQLKERFLGIVTVPLFIFYTITILEIIYLPELGTVLGIYIANTFFFLCFMLFFLWSSFYQYQTAKYSAFSYKHPIIPQKVTFSISMLIFIMGYAVFVPLGDLQPYRLWFMSGVIAAIAIYLWLNFEFLANAFRNKILIKLWSDY